MAACLIYATFPDRAIAEEVARRMVDARLAACANLLPGMTSIFRWESVVVAADEVVLILKTRDTLAERLVAEVRALHPYDVPAILVLPVAGGSAPFLEWIAAETDEGA